MIKSFCLFCSCDLRLKIVLKNRASDEGFLIKSFSNLSEFVPVQFQNLLLENQQQICFQMGFLNFFALSYPKKLKRNSSYAVVKCSKLNCNLLSLNFISFVK